MYYDYKIDKKSDKYVVMMNKLDGAGYIVIDINIYTYASTESEARRVCDRMNAEIEGAL